ncbi:cytochrome c biogenesis CcdA family protein [Geosporobacter subterraneus]|nr:cytochrome c biogenesis protein CcdA [Geosporobacter subterraneus]
MDVNANMWLTLAAVFGTGTLSGLSPCTLPTIMLVMGYVGGTEQNTKWRSFQISLSFVLGIAVTLSLLGGIAGTVGGVFLNIGLLNYILAAIVIIMGLWMLDVIDLGMKQFSFFTPKKGSGNLGAFLLGLPFGILASPCTTPILGGVLAYAASKGSSLYGFILLFIYAIGRSIPILIVGTFTGLIKNLSVLDRFQKPIKVIGGIILILLGMYLVWKA